jgi:hypothetical protein
MSQVYLIYLKKYNQSIWQLAGKYIKPDSLPQSSDRYDTDLMQFSLSFIGLKDVDGNNIIIEDGDDIVVLDNTSKTSIFNNMCGRVIRYSVIPHYKRKIFEGEYILETILEYDLTIEQRDFSTKYSDIYQTIPITIIDLIDKILNPVSDLGGTMPSGSYIDKYVFLPDIVSIPSIELSGSEKEQLKQALTTIGVSFKMQYYCEPHTTNILKVLQQILIYKL